MTQRFQEKFPKNLQLIALMRKHIKQHCRIIHRSHRFVLFKFHTELIVSFTKR